MKKLFRHSDNVFVIGMILALMIGAGILSMKWQLIRDYWQTNFDDYSVPPDDMMTFMGRDSVSVPIDVPLFMPVESAIPLFDAYAPVIVVDYEGQERAYPLALMALHEIVNDDFEDVPVAVTYCPICNSAMVYRREIDGRSLRMGVSGNFYGNNFLMYDDLTESWWFQLTGEAIVGDLTGERLEIIPSQVVGFQTFAGRYPLGEVLIGDADSPDMNYRMSPYDAYQSGQSPLLSHDDYDTRLDAMARVLATVIYDTAIAYPFETLRQSGVINDTVNGQPVVIFWQPGIRVNRDAPETIGQAAAFGRELNGTILSFRYEEGRILDNETDSGWNIFGEAISGELAGETLDDYPCYTHFWFAWSSAYPDTLVYDMDN